MGMTSFIQVMSQMSSWISRGSVVVYLAFERAEHVEIYQSLR